MFTLALLIIGMLSVLSLFTLTLFVTTRVLVISVLSAALVILRFTSGSSKGLKMH